MVATRGAKMVRVCDECGAEFERLASQLRGKAVYCSHACRAAGVGKRNTRDVAERFWSKVDRSSDEGCWPWTAGASAEGYGMFRTGGQHGLITTANRMAYILTHGPLPDDEDVCHSCDNPPCCRPSHLFRGTRAVNMQDAFRKGRSRGLLVPGEFRGERQGQSKLTDDAVREIRRRYAAGGVRQSDLAAEFGVSKSLISYVVSGKGWKHVV